MLELKKYLKSIPHAHIYPMVLVLIFIGLVSFKINGSSIGVYYNYLYGYTSEDPNLIAGKPQPIRSDEWLVNTQLTIAQEKNGYQYINNNINDGRDMSLVVDTPYIEWSALFKPQNFSFFFLPFEYAFAFKWWFLILSLLISVYYFALKMMKKINLAILMSVVASFSPFVFWWYQTSTIMSLTYGFLILLVSMNIINRKPLKLFKKNIPPLVDKVVKTIILTYLLSSFALILYPPFQIPIAVVVAFFLVGYLFNTLRDKPKKDLRAIILPFLTAILLTAAVCGLFLGTRGEAIQAITNTVYPGARIVKSGGYDANRLLTSYLQIQLQDERSGPKYIKNQSESSNFILLPTFFIIPAIILFIYLLKRTKKIDYILLSLILCSLLFLAQLFIPHIDMLTKLFLFSYVPNERLAIGMGFMAILLITYILNLYLKAKVKLSNKVMLFLIIYMILCFAIMIWSGLETRAVFPDFIASRKLILILTSILLGSIFLILANKPQIGLIIIALFSIASVYQIHPLYRGLGVFYNNEVTNTIQKISSKDSVWAAAQNIYIENLPQVSGRPSVTGVSAYPNASFWKKYSESNNDTIYNRYAHTFLSSNDSASLILVGSDLYAISASCTRKITEKIDYIISTTPLEGACNQLLKILKYPNVTFYFYKQ